MKRRKINLLIIAIYIIFILVNIMIYLKNNDSETYEVNSTIAKPIIVIEKDEPIEQEINLLQNTIDYDFTIKNYNENEINEIDCEYTITLENTENNFPIKYSIYDYSNDKYMQLENGKSKIFKLAKNEKEDKKYRVNVEWNNISGELANETDMNLKIEVVQTKEGKG